MTQDDSISTFSYSGRGCPDTFSLHELSAVVNSHFGTVCSLKKLGEGGFHKVYDIVQDDGTSLGVARVAAPVFPKDKLESEVATVKFLAAHTDIPVPKVYSWNSDPSNPVGAEYMLMQKVLGFSASEKWDTLSATVKESVVSQVADHLMAIFALRFDCAGSLYLSPRSESGVIVGPVIRMQFYRALNGVVRICYAGATPCAELSRFRGPFSNTTDYLQSFLLAKIHFISHHRSAILSELNGEGEEMAVIRLRRAEHTLQKGLELCSVYPGDMQIYGQEAAPILQPFSLRLKDLRLSNIMIDDSGRVTGFIDFEAATISPLWECALVPRWLIDPDDSEASYEGGSAESRERLRVLFLEKVGKEWRVLYEQGKPFRRLIDRLVLGVSDWASDNMEEWVNERLAWARKYPGVGLPDGILFEEEDEEDEGGEDEDEEEEGKFPILLLENSEEITARTAKFVLQALKLNETGTALAQKRRTG